VREPGGFFTCPHGNALAQESSFILGNKVSRNLTLLSVNIFKYLFLEEIMLSA
jgi:hypothetical protein